MFHSYEWATISCSSHIYGEKSLVDQNPLAELYCRKSGGCHVHQIASQRSTISSSSAISSTIRWAGDLRSRRGLCARLAPWRVPGGRGVPARSITKEIGELSEVSNRIGLRGSKSTACCPAAISHSRTALYATGRCQRRPATPVPHVSIAVSRALRRHVS
jgi:hypothetical protein